LFFDPWCFLSTMGSMCLPVSLIKGLSEDTPKSREVPLVHQVSFHFANAEEKHNSRSLWVH